MSSLTMGELKPYFDDFEDDDGGRGQTFVQTTKPGETVFSRRRATPVERRVDVTTLVDELEFLAASGVHPQALASKIKAARNEVRRSPSWARASYADPSRHWDDTASLESRINDVQAAFEARFGPLRQWSW